MNEVFWIEGTPSRSLAVVLCPRGPDWLEDELASMKTAGIDVLVSLLGKPEAEWLGLAEESYAAIRLGIEFLSHPIPDGHVPPDTASFRTFVSGLAARIRAGQRIGVHCRGSIGRATVTAACTLIHLGWKPAAALAAVEAARGCQVPETEEQKHWVLNYKAQA